MNATVGAVMLQGRRYTLYLSNGSRLIVPWSIYQELPLQEGNEVTDEYLLQLGLREYKHALNKAVSLLALRARSEREISDALTRAGYVETAVAAVMQKLMEKNLLDDKEFANAYVAQAMRSKKGAMRIRAELRHKGVSNEIIDTVLTAVDPDDGLAACRAALQKAERTCHEQDHRLRRQKLVQTLMRRGFSYGQIKTAMEAEASD